MFLSGDWLKDHASKIFNPFNAKQIDCAAYTMRVGHEAYVSPEYKRPLKPIQQLAEKDTVLIPPGQFAFLITREFLTIPIDMIGLINLKNSLKVQGLVNVSGFHVDPGYRGHLVFAVFNAGPKVLLLREGDDAFLIWLARLEQPSAEYARQKQGFLAIDSQLASNIPRESASINSLSRRLDRVDTQFSYIVWGFGVLVLIAVSFLGDRIFKHWGG